MVNLTNMKTAFPSNMSKNIIFSISKYYFIYFNILLYNTPNIKGFFIYFLYHFIKILFILIEWERESSGERHRRTTQERVRERKKMIKKTLASCYNGVSSLTLHCSKDVKNFKNNMLDVDDILRGWELKLGFSIFNIFDVNAYREF